MDLKPITQKKVQKKTKLRKLGICEQFFWLSDKHSDYNTNVSFRICNDVTEEKIREAISYLKKRYFLLRSHIVENENNELFFRENTQAKIPIEFITTNRKNQWKQRAIEDLHTRFKNGDHFIKVSVLKSKHHIDIIITCHHLIADGRSQLLLVKEFLNFVYDIKSAPLDDPLAYSSIDEFIPEHSVSQTPFDLITKQSSLCHSMNSSSQSGFVFQSLTEEETSLLCVFCKKHSVTVHSALLAAMLFGMKEILKKSKVSSADIKWESPVDLRPYLPMQASKQLLGSHIGMLSFLQSPRGLTNFWALAKEIRCLFQDHVTPYTPSYALNSYKKLLKKSSNETNINKQRKWTGPFVGVSNLGRLDLSFGNLSEKVKFLTPLVALHKNFSNKYSLYLYTFTFQNRLYLNYIYPKSILPISKAKEFVRAINAQIRKQIASYASS